MAVFNGAFPILPDKVDDARAFAREVEGPHRAQHDALQRQEGITRETWSLLQTPAGAFMLVWFEAPDIEAAFTTLATADDDHASWFRGRVKDVTGVDLTEQQQGGPELLLDWRG